MIMVRNTVKLTYFNSHRNAIISGQYSILSLGNDLRSMINHIDQTQQPVFHLTEPEKTTTKQNGGQKPAHEKPGKFLTSDTNQLLREDFE